MPSCTCFDRITPISKNKVGQNSNRCVTEVKTLTGPCKGHEQEGGETKSGNDDTCSVCNKLFTVGGRKNSIGGSRRKRKTRKRKRKKKRKNRKKTHKKRKKRRKTKNRKK